MPSLNFKHLRYFWVVAANGTIARAAEILHVTPQTISGQLRELEEQIDAKLFQKSGRNLVLTDTGRLVFSYADEMFRLGDELQDVIEGRSPGAALTLTVGVAMVVPKLLAYRVLEPVLNMPESVHLVCLEASLADLLADLSVHKIDLVLADAPMSPTLNVRAYNHLLGESGLSFFTTRKAVRKYKAGFPQSLNGAPMLMPTASSALRSSLEQWLEQMKAFGEAGTGIFTSPTAVEEDVVAKYGVSVIGRTEEIKECFYAISAERRIKHPAVSAITEAARTGLFMTS